MDLLRSRGIKNTSIEELHWRSFDLWKSAGDSTSVATSEALASSAALSNRPVYNTVRRSLDDLVQAVLILLALAIPFAFALERLIIGSTNIYRQISWFCGFFIVTFAILYLVHPAFAISDQSMIIFLAFALLVLSSLVITVIMQKFGTELKVMQGLTSTVHNADVSRYNTMMAAVGMGISTMRRRPLRTALTALTITLLTYTILNFASFDTRTGIVTLFDGSSPKYTGVLLHRVNWAPIDVELLSVMQGRWGNDATLASRYWLPAGTDPATENGGPLITRKDGSMPLVLRGLLGMEPQELSYRSDIRAMFGSGAEALKNGIFLTTAQAKQLGVRVDDTVLLGGIPLQVAGLLDPAVVGALRDMDDSEILPVDFSIVSSTQPTTAQQQQQVSTGADVLAAAQNRQDWVPLPIEAVAIVSADVAQKLGASLRAVTLYTPDPQSATTIAEDMARMLPLPITATRIDGVYTHVLAPIVMATGVKDLIFPIILGALVIFGTMLGSVADREKEIYTFSALGLAPAHVATLFFAEAMVYSFIGGMGGYLLAQGAMKVLGGLSQLGVVHGVPEMNYSSLNAIFAILIVMATVLISAIYPAFKASRSANPGVLRSYKMVKPDGDRFDIVFPFTVSQYDITGVVSFLKEHFDNFSDTSLGVFMARDTVLVREGASLGLRAHLSLAPFDLGVTQAFYLHSIASEIEGIDEVKIELQRYSGQSKDWERLNKVLLDDLRRQFLIWRAIPQETMELYRERTLIALGEATEKPADPPAASVPQSV